MDSLQIPQDCREKQTENARHSTLEKGGNSITLKLKPDKDTIKVEN